MITYKAQTANGQQLCTVLSCWLHVSMIAAPARSTGLNANVKPWVLLPVVEQQQ
jgi:hypothetical protein